MSGRISYCISESTKLAQDNLQKVAMTINDTLIIVANFKQVGKRTTKYYLLLLFSILLTSMVQGFPGSNNIALSKGDNSKSSKPLIRMVAGYSNDSTSFDPFVIYYDDLATYNFDGQYDALKIYNTDRNVPNYFVTSNDGRQLSINGIPFCDSTCVFNLGLKTEKDGTIIFKIRDIDESLSEKTIIINDKISGINKVLRPDEEYSVFLLASNYPDRFTLSISSATVGLPEIRLRDDIFRVFSSNGILKVEINESHRVGGIITLINLSGNVILRRKVDYSGYYEYNLSCDRGIYIVSFVSEGKICTKKLFLGTN